MANKQVKAKAGNKSSEPKNQILSTDTKLFQKKAHHVSAQMKRALSSEEFKQEVENNKICELIDAIEDHRINRTKLYSLSEVIFSTLMAVMAGARSWYEISEFANDLLDTLKTFYPFKNGVPSHDTYNRFFAHFQTKKLEGIFSRFFELEVDGKKTGIKLTIEGKLIRVTTPEPD